MEKSFSLKQPGEQKEIIVSSNTFERPKLKRQNNIQIAPWSPKIIDFLDYANKLKN
jgi:hypothetical protein